MKQIDVVGGIIIENDQVLCLQRGPGLSLEYLWEFPGGKVKDGETQQDALARELQEELSIEVTVQEEIFDTSSYVYSFGQVNLTTIICHLKTGEPQLSEHAAMKWLGFDQLKELDWAPADIPAVEKLMRMYGEA